MLLWPNIATNNAMTSSCKLIFLNQSFRDILS